MPKTLKWLRGVQTASVNDERCGLRFEIKQNTEKSNPGERYLYRCTDTSNRLMFERQLDIATAMVVVNGWTLEPEVKELTDKH